MQELCDTINIVSVMCTFRLYGRAVARLDVATNFVQQCHAGPLMPTSSSATTDLGQYTLVTKSAVANMVAKLERTVRGFFSSTCAPFHKLFLHSWTTYTVSQKVDHPTDGDSFVKTVTITVTKVFIMRFLLKDRKCSTKSFTTLASTHSVKLSNSAQRLAAIDEIRCGPPK